MTETSFGRSTIRTDCAQFPSIMGPKPWGTRRPAACSTMAVRRTVGAVPVLPGRGAHAPRPGPVRHVQPMHVALTDRLAVL